MEYQDYKYIISDWSKVSIGARMTYQEICDHDYAPFKFVAIIHQYLYKEEMPEATVQEHLLSLQKDSMSYMVFSHLKIKVKMNIYTESTDRHGKVRGEWLIDQIMTVEEYVKEESYHQYPEHAVVTEIILSKLHLMSFTL